MKTVIIYLPSSHSIHAWPAWHPWRLNNYFSLQGDYSLIIILGHIVISISFQVTMKPYHKCCNIEDRAQFPVQTRVKDLTFQISGHCQSSRLRDMADSCVMTRPMQEVAWKAWAQHDGVNKTQWYLQVCHYHFVIIISCNS